MNLHFRQIPLLLSFSLALIFLLCGTALLPHVRLVAFSPFLALLYNRANFVKSLWIASLCGIVVDLACSEMRLGVYALNYCGTTLLLYKQKHHFFEDKPLALSLFTALISVVSTLLQFFLISIFGQGLPLSGKLLVTDLVFMPFGDAVYAYLWFTCPMFLYAYIKKTGWRGIYNKVIGFCYTSQKNLKK